MSESSGAQTVWVLDRGPTELNLALQIGDASRSVTAVIQGFGSRNLVVDLNGRPLNNPALFTVAVNAADLCRKVAEAVDTAGPASTSTPPHRPGLIAEMGTAQVQGPPQGLLDLARH